MLKHFSGGFKEWLLLVCSGALLIAALLLPLRFALADGLTSEEEQLMEAYRSGELIRIHVIANSDLPQDQALKLKVRDALIEAFGAMLMQAGQQNSEAVYQLLQENEDAMQQAAQACAAQNGFKGKVTAEAGIHHLPQKRYGSVVLPEGDYRALRVTIGNGAGQNWWCVLYPQLCLALAETEDKTETSLFFSSERIFRHWLLMSAPSSPCSLFVQTRDQSEADRRDER